MVEPIWQPAAVAALRSPIPAGQPGE